jgi:sugar phosphate isomerase/epimerase
MTGDVDRRDYDGRVAGLAVGAAAGETRAQKAEPWVEISLAEWSFHRALFAGTMDHLEFAKTAKHQFGIDAVEYVNQFFKDRATDRGYLAEMKRRCSDLGVRSHLIMCDGEGELGDADPKRRTTAVENHYKWVEAARFLGCFAIRVNAASTGTYEEQLERAADGLHRLASFGGQHGIAVIVENHGGLSSNGQWLAALMRKVNLPTCGTLPDFGNFDLGEGRTYDAFQGTAELMPFAKAVSAKALDFDAAGNETTIDYRRMLRIVRDAGFRSYVGIEYSGDRLPEAEGVRATKGLLEKVRSELA